MTGAVATALRLLPLVGRDWLHHPWRQAVAVLAVSLGVALAWSVHVINTSALDEFAAAVRSANGEPDASVRGPRDGLDEGLIDTLAQHPAVASVHPAVEAETLGRTGETAPTGPRVGVRVVGVDALGIAAVAPDLLARPAPQDGPGTRWTLLDPAHVFANAAARQRWGLTDGQALWLQSGDRWQRFTVAGTVPAGGPPLVVLDVAAAQAFFGLERRVSRLDLRLKAGADAAALAPLLPPGATLQRPGVAEQRVSNLSRAYRVNLTVLAGVALLVGSFLVYSVMALSVAQRTPQLALLGVLGLSPAEQRAGVLLEGFATGALGSVAGLLLGTGLAQLALWALAGDLGGGLFASSGAPPPMRVQPWAAAVFGALGVLAAMVGAWVPARQAGMVQPAQALKGLGSLAAAQPRALPGVLLCAAGTALAFLPAVGGLPLAAYASVAAWLFGGVALVPWAVDALLRLVPPPAGAVPRLAVERARHQRAAATAAVAGVVASLALCVALTVMVSSFRDGVVRWLDQVLPADLYARTGQTSAQADTLRFPPALLETLRAHPDVARVQVARSRALTLQPQLPAVTLFARELDDPAAALPLLERPLPPTPGTWGVYVSEAMVTLHGARVGGPLLLPLGAGGRPVETRVLGVWRDYARQFGTVAMPLSDYQRLTGDERLNDVALWLKPGAKPDAVQQLLRDAAQGSGLDFASAAELRQLSLRIFDRSFAVTRYLQVVAIAIGIIGVGASLSAQVLARRKEFGLLVHLGFTPRQLLAMVCAEVGTWLLAGAAVGLALGTVISVVLVHVVNPQSFHWTMELVWPAGRLLALCAAVLLAGLLTTAFTARKAAGAPAVQAVKEDW